MSNTKTYTFTEEQLRAVIEDAVDLRDHEVAMNPLLGKPVRTPAAFADEYAKTLGGTFNKNEKEEVKQEEKQMDNPETYTFTREQLHQAFLSAVIRRSDEIIRENQGCGNAWIGRVSTFEKFAEDAVNRLVGASTAPKSEVKEAEETGSEEDVWARRAKEDAELSNDQDEDARLAAEKEPEVEDEDDEEDEPKGYVSSRPVDKLQFNIDTVKLANLPGLFNTLKSEGVFFKPIANRWNAGEVDECGVDRLGESSGTLSNALSDLHYCTDNFWVNPKYANKKVGSLGGIGSRVIAEDGKTSVCLWVYYLEKDGTVIAWDMDVD